MLLLFACVSPEAVAPLTIQARSEEGLYALGLTFTPGPTVGPQELAIEADMGLALEVTPYMPAHGHGVADVTDVTEADGVYTLGWTWPMAGAWEITIEVDGEPGPDTAVVVVDVE